MTYHILVADDEPDTQELISQRFRREIRLKKYEFIFVHNGSQAYDAIQQMPEIDMVLTDINMPEMDGLTLLSKLQNDETLLKTVVVSAYGDMAHIRKAMNLGAFDFLTKPLDFKDLIVTVEKTLNVVMDAKATQQKLQTAQAQTDKLSSLGQMMADIAHEIKNPVGFVSANIEPTKAYIQDLLTVLELYQKHYPEPDLEIQQLLAELELDFLVEDLQKILSSLAIGTQRIQDLVLSLRDFSRPDQPEKTAVDIHQGIDNTLLLLQHRLRATKSRPVVELVRNYGPLPPVTCYPNQLNQVVLNLLVNALDALEEKCQDTMQQHCQDISSFKIQIRTEQLDDNWVRIAIADNGSGIEPDIMPQLFDAFFSTKPMGQGTGLGLSISYQLIVKNHGGCLSCQSAPGKGTEFWIDLPLS
ncbi:MAG: hybrid sensor histidine kinase/response regulator [Spirulina sp. SIO3F2]|nr:hybrid sensor histidine kinase/response regulator [Spirulina sp. SIO3F2]